MSFTKTSCPISRATFLAKAPRNVVVEIAGVKYSTVCKEFSTGSLGYNLTAKATVEVDGVLCPVQIGLNLTLVGSKELPTDAPAMPAMPTAAPATVAA